MAATGRPVLGPLVNTALGADTEGMEAKYLSRSSEMREVTSYFEPGVDGDGVDAIMGVPTRREDD